jgi:hypothetical protein
VYLPDLPPGDLVRAIEHAFAGGASGVSLFEAGLLTEAHLKALAGVLR